MHHFLKAERAHNYLTIISGEDEGKKKNSPLPQSEETNFDGPASVRSQRAGSQLCLWSHFRQFALSHVNLLPCMFCIFFYFFLQTAPLSLQHALIIDGCTTANLPFKNQPRNINGLNIWTRLQLLLIALSLHQFDVNFRWYQRRTCSMMS